jgi:uncharacterized RmlC-like cupin family protein
MDAMGLGGTAMTNGTGGANSVPRPSPLLEVVKADARVEIVRAAQARRERYQVILPRQDRRGWRMASVEGPPGRLELVTPDLCSARGIHLSVVTLRVGVKDSPHFHVSGEKVMYVVRGSGRIIAGEEFEEAHDVGPGDAVYVPPFAVHAPMNTGEEPFEFVMASNAPLDVTVPGGVLPEEGKEVLA